MFFFSSFVSVGFFTLFVLLLNVDLGSIIFTFWTPLLFVTIAQTTQPIQSHSSILCRENVKMNMCSILSPFNAPLTQVTLAIIASVLQQLSVF